jgi:hypothetical protein
METPVWSGLRVRLGNVIENMMSFAYVAAGVS